MANWIMAFKSTEMAILAIKGAEHVFLALRARNGVVDNLNGIVESVGRL